MDTAPGQSSYHEVAHDGCDQGGSLVGPEGRRSDALPNGAYHARLGQAQSLKPRVLMYSSVFSRFYGEAPHSGYFDEKDRQELKQQFVQALLAALLQHEV